MPLFMGVYLIGEVTLDNARKAHLADLAVQEKYGVTYLQYWINKEAGIVFCLIKGPDKESCEASHREANGIKACRIIEVEGGMYDIFMGESHKIDQGLVRHEDGKIDTGYRFIFTLDMTANTTRKDPIEFDQLKLPKKSKAAALRIIEEYEGKTIKTAGFDNIIAVFEFPEKVLRCAYEIQKEFLNCQNNPNPEIDKVDFNMGIGVGQPLTQKEGFFEKAIQMSQRLCFIADCNEIIIPKLFEELCDTNEIIKQQIHLQILNYSEQDFMNNLLDIAENKFSEHGFGVDSLSRDLGISQPQLYRKVTAITGRSPVKFIRDIRLNKALSLLKENKYNLSEVALEVGYRSPSYFSKCFHEKFGIQPSKIII
jgi:AraC-like DNA-binding protein